MVAQAGVELIALQARISKLPCGCRRYRPAGLVDGELDVVTLSIAAAGLKSTTASEPFRRMRFAFADPLGVALSRQVLAELYAPQAPERDLYVSALVNALKAHILRGSSTADVPTFRPPIFGLSLAPHPECGSRSIRRSLTPRRDGGRCWGHAFPFLPCFFAGPPVNHPITT